MLVISAGNVDVLPFVILDQSNAVVLEPISGIVVDANNVTCFAATY